MRKKYKKSLVIGRFQPFHFGHAYLIKKALEISENIIIGIGSSNVVNKDNPFTFKERKKMIELFIKNEKISDRVFLIVSLPDYNDDNKWLKQVVKKVKDFNLVVGNNDWVNGIFKNAGYQVKEFPYYKRYILKGTKIRKKIEKKESLNNRVPDYIQKYLHNLKR